MAPSGKHTYPTGTDTKHHFFIGNLHYDATPKEISTAFSAAGFPVNDVRIIENFPARFAFVRLEDERTAPAAFLACRNIVIRGRQLRTSLAKKNDKNEDCKNTSPAGSSKPSQTETTNFKSFVPPFQTATPKTPERKPIMPAFTSPNDTEGSPPALTHWSKSPSDSDLDISPKNQKPATTQASASSFKADAATAAAATRSLWAFPLDHYEFTPMNHNVAASSSDERVNIIEEDERPAVRMRGCRAGRRHKPDHERVRRAATPAPRTGSPASAMNQTPNMQQTPANNQMHAMNYTLGTNRAPIQANRGHTTANNTPSRVPFNPAPVVNTQAPMPAARQPVRLYIQGLPYIQDPDLMRDFIGDIFAEFQPTDIQLGRVPQSARLLGRADCYAWMTVASAADAAAVVTHWHGSLFDWGRLFVTMPAGAQDRAREAARLAPA